MNLRTKYRAVESNDHRHRGIKHSLGYLYRLLLWRGTVLHRRGGAMCSGGGFTDRWLHLVLGTGEHEEQDGEPGHPATADCD